MILNAEEREWLTLALLPGVGTAHFIRLLARFRTPANVLSASRGALEEVVGKKLAGRIAAYADTADVTAQERAMTACGAKLITLEHPDFPLRLAEIYDPPLLLFVRGELLPEDAHCVGVVGTRRATPYGIRMAERFGRELAGRGVTVVSGMAAGVDAAAHRGAIEAGGRTIAVLGCGTDVVFPPQHADLMEDIADHGAVVSQFPMGMKPIRGNFPYRNRIISGMSLGTLVVEAPMRSGALITARQAAEQGREVFAIPGQLGVKNSEGPHALIREGAKLVETVDDILVELELPAQCMTARVRSEPDTPPASSPDPSHHEAASAAPQTAVATPTIPKAASADERKVLNALSPDGSYVDEIASACHISVSEALSSLTLLELKGLVRQFSGKRFAPR